MVFYILLLVLTPAAIVAFAQRLIQRKAPSLQLPSDSSLTLEKNGLINPKERDLIHHQAFLNDRKALWIATGKTSPPQEPALVAWHEKVNHYVVESHLTWTEQHGYVLTCRDDQTEELQGVICLTPPVYYSSDNPSWQHKLQRYAAVRPSGHPFSQREDDSWTRFQAFTETTAKKHAEIMENQPHWYIPLIGVTESAQDQQIRSKQLQEALQVTGNKHPIYLECQPEDVEFYKSMGFERMERYEPLIKVHGSDDYHSIAMVRPSEI